MKSVLTRYWGIAFICLVFTLRYADMLWGENVFTAYGDYTYLICPVFSYISEIFQSGEVPLWIKGMLGGTQIYDTTQFSITYPFYFFRTIDYGDPFTTYQWIKYFTLLHILILGINTYILARILDNSNIASAIAGIIIMISSNTAIYATWIMIIAGYAWLPLFLAGIIACFKYDSYTRGPIIAAVGFSGFMANPAQPVIHGLVMALPIVFYGLFRNRIELKTLFSKFSLAGLLAFGLSAVGIIPAVVNYKEMIRWVGKSGAVRGYESLPFEAFELELPLNTFHNFIWDQGIWSSGPGHHYLGPIAMIFSIVGLFHILKNKTLKHRWIYGVLSVLAFYFLISAYGKALGLTYINFYIPLINKIREPARHLIIYTVGFSLFAAVGYDVISRYLDHTSNKRKSILISCAFLICCLILIPQTSSNYSYINFNPFVTAAALGIILLLSNILKKHQLPVAVLVLLGFNSLINKKANQPTPDRWQINKPHNLKSLETLKKLKNSGKISKDDRIVFYDKNLNNQRWTMNATSYGLRGFQTSFSPVHARQFDQLHHCDWNYNYRSLLGAKWYIINKDVQPKETELNKQYTIGDFDIYLNPKAKAKLFFGGKPIAYDGTKNAFFGLIKKDKYFDKHVYVNREDLESIESHLSQNTCNLNKQETQISADKHNEVVAYLNLNKPEIIVYNEFNNGDWQAKLNGKKIDIINVNLNQMAVLIPCGSHKLELIYRPLLYTFLRYLQLITFYSLLLFVILNLLKYFKLIELPTIMRI